MVCLACGMTSSPPSREHVFSKWLLSEFGPDLSVGLFRQLGDGSREPHRAEIRLDSFRLKKICERCNTGWMSQLEEETKPIILGIIRGARNLNSLSDEERRTLARWAGKTAIVESHAVGAECPVDSVHFNGIRTNKDGFPGRFGAVVCRTKLVGFGHMQVGVIRDLIGGGKASGNIIAIALPALVFVCAFPMLEIPYKCGCVPSLTPLWPRPSAWYSLEEAANTDVADELEELTRIVEGVELFHPFR